MSVEQSSLHRRVRILSHSVMHQISVPGAVDEDSFEVGYVWRHLTYSESTAGIDITHILHTVSFKNLLILCGSRSRPLYLSPLRFHSSKAQQQCVAMESVAELSSKACYARELL